MEEAQNLLLDDLFFHPPAFFIGGFVFW